MTAIAAVFGAGAPAAGDGIRRMLDAAAHRGAAAAAIWQSGAVTLGHRASVGRNGVPHAPFAATPDGNAIVFDGRLDNRDDLRRALPHASPASDAALALAAYAKWSEEAPVHLLGDFAFAVWDARRRRLVCARDVLGQRPLFHGSIAGATLVASEAQQVLAHPAFAAIVNEGAIAESLTGTPMSVEETIWKGVIRLPAAHALIVTEDGARRARYWDFDPDARLEYARDAEYAEHFLDLFRTAIECRTRDAAAVGVFLSGGLDSSAIAGVAQLLARERGGAPLRAFAMTFPGLAVDETPYIDAVAQKWDLATVRLVARPPSRRDIEREIDHYRDLPTFPNCAVLDALGRPAASEVDVVLTGCGGDEWFAGSLLHTADLLRQGRVVTAVKQFRHDVALPGRGYRPADLFRIAVSPLLPRVIRAALRPVAGGRRPVYPWIRPEFAARVALRDRLRPAAPAACRTLVQRETRAQIRMFEQVLGSELDDRGASAAGLDVRHPFNDRRLMEFAFALPEAQRWSGGETKVVMRRALGPVLPESVLRRNDKAEFSSTFVESLKTLGGRAFFDHLRSAEVAWVDQTVTQRMYDEMIALYTQGRESYIPVAVALWSVAAVELWLTQHHKERSP
jgi:asparagine synthase (glutamine-hydrolysing)